ncbi:hypothetical protein BCT75_04330 [Vibrio lentus]|uniref:ParA family protein n=1 Tax=Vibrio lentus TaxID=136468 RepID=UPI000C844413|nr:ParA family protein [Vibrio lentus]PML45616.1 hypothetical protein BCT75_04330 [Vibrio lentus]
MNTPTITPLFTSSKVIVVASSKGGVGKSMAAVNLAVDFANDGHNVLLVDAEKDGTTIDWQSRDIENLTIMGGYDLAFTKMINVYRQAYDVIVIDTAGVNADMASDSRENLQEEINKKCLAQSDFILIPLEPSPVVVRKSVRFISSVQTYVDASFGKRDALIFLNMAVSNEKLTIASQNELADAFEIPVSEVLVRRYTEYKQAEGEFKTVNEFRPKSNAALDMRELRNDIVSRINAMEA